MRYLIPMAADSDLFPRSEFHFPKPLIEIDGQPMIQHVVDHIRRHDRDAEFVFIVRKSHCDEFSLDQTLQLASDGRCQIIKIINATKGAACSALMAIDVIDDDEPLVICNADQVIETDIAAINRRFADDNLEAGVITFPSVHPRWSFVKVDERGLVVEAAEKRVLSRRAIAGYYYFRRGRDFVAAACGSIQNGADSGRLFFIAPTLNELVLRGSRVGFHEIAEAQYQSFYSPQRLDAYLRRIERPLAAAQADKPLQIVIPMAGLGSRFAQAGYAKPKPFIDVVGMTMIERVLENLKIANARFILLARREHMQAEPEVVSALKARGDVTFWPVDQLTEGAACTISLARRALDPDAPLLVANCDQIIDFDCSAFIAHASARALDGSILVFKDVARDPKWSFVRLDGAGFAAEVKEKVAISDIATVGVYFFKTARMFFDAALDMIALNDRVNNEFYVCPVYTYLIRDGLKVGVYEIAASAMHGIGTPDDLNAYIKLIAPGS